MKERSLYDVILINAEDDVVVDSNRLIASSAEMVKQKIGFDTETLDRIDNGTYVVNVVCLATYQKPENK